jgi:hypothetical protein
MRAAGHNAALGRRTFGVGPAAEQGGCEGVVLRQQVHARDDGRVGQADELREVQKGRGFRSVEAFEMSDTVRPSQAVHAHEGGCTAQTSRVTDCCGDEGAP